MTETRPKVLRIASVAVAAAAILAAGVVLVRPLYADGLRVAPVKDPVVRKECGACHLIYPAGLLPARSWTAMMAGLSDHFGDNASLDDATAARIGAYLTANAADAGRWPSRVLRRLPDEVTPARITDLPWWKRKHERKDRVAPATLARKGAKFKGDCKACHEDAERGLFDDD
ncbi:hypothetical protein RHODGE_RHODGE_04366 [Rhodoplanes serenus]|uniref:Cytochrome C n=1 Tax=Rhodoplanes serenus TaxID=200615 RepID=A0A447D0T4_9BRAD|nr:diheme cytochrome c [Rhodoplanes serenus]VCU11160.1 hypothetical protein RHODGE_RHODGE_04366 [Rhodoplanes serenus]